MATKFGHWNVTNEGIEWDNEKRGNYFIPSDRLLELTERSGTTMYDWLVHVPQKTWVNELDTKDLNEAFIFLAKNLNLEVDNTILNDSIEYQSHLF